ncbi:MAG: WD40/YVTN/BNR-like repeat-containing protein [Acidothermaceae bacterium]
MAPMDDGSDDLERRLRNVLRSQRLSIEPTANALARIHEGARRRQQRRSATSAIAGVVVVAIVASAFALHPRGASSVTADNHQAIASSPGLPSPAPNPSASRPMGAPIASPVTSLAIESATPKASLPLMSASDASNAPTVFNALSVSAISTNDWWVLGYSTTTYANETASAGILAHTIDGGVHFTVGQPELPVANPLMRQPAGAMFVASIRFGDANDGWAFDTALYSTTNGGSSWSAVSGIPGAVVDLVAANGVAWAVVDLSQTGMPTLPPSLASDAHYAIYSTPYGNSPQHWARVAMPFELGAAQPSIVDQDGTVTVLASGPFRDSDLDHALVAAPGRAFTDHVGPCLQELGGSLSNSSTAVWGSCLTGSSTEIAVSTDRGASWRPTGAHFGNAGPGGIGAIDTKSAILYNIATSSLTRLSANSGRVELADAIGKGATGSSFIGFTNLASGFAIIRYHDGSSELWRTTDSGLHWSVVRLDLK